MLIVILLIILIFIISYRFGSAEKKKDVYSYYMGQVWFDAAKKGTKTIDLRPGPLEKYKKLEGKIIEFVHKDESIKAEVKKVTHISAWKELEKNAYKSIAPHLGSNAELEAAMANYYKISETSGVCLIHFKLAPASAKLDKKPPRKDVDADVKSRK